MLFSCGRNGEGQLGQSGVDSHSSDLSVAPIPEGSASPSNVSCGYQHTLVLLADGQVLSCGKNDDQQLGRDGPRRKLMPISLLRGLKIVQVACGQAHSLALTQDGRIFGWGSNQVGQLGVSQSKFEMKTDEESGIAIREVNLTEVVAVACGAFHSLALKSDGTLYSWGSNQYGQLGVGRRNPVFESQPQEITSLKGIPIRRIAAGEFHSVVLSVSGALFAWGRGDFGQLGDGKGKDSFHAVHLKNLKNMGAVEVVCGYNHNAVLTLDGRVFTWGQGGYGQLGLGKIENENLPRQVTELMGSKVRLLTCGSTHTLAAINERIYAFGAGGSGQLGLEKTDFTHTPTQLPWTAKPNGYDGDSLCLQRLAAGGYHSFVLVGPKNVASNNNNNHNGSSNGGLVVDIPLIYLTVPKIQEYLRTSQLKQLDLTVQHVFCSSACLNCSFLVEGIDHFGIRLTNHGVDLDGVAEGFRLLTEENQSAVSTQKAMSESLRWSLFDSLTSSPPHLECLRLYLILPFAPLFDDPALFKEIHVPFATSLISLAELPSNVIEAWWTTFKTRHFNRLLKVFKNVVTHILELPPLTTDFVSRSEASVRQNAMKVCLEVLAKLNKVNSQSHAVPFDRFYLNELTERVDIRSEYVRFYSDKTRFSFCKYPFLFNAAVKTLLLQTDAAIQMEFMVAQANQYNLQALFSPVLGQICPYLILTVSRTNIVEDTINQLAHCQPIDLKKPLKVKFTGEEADDAGGVRKEFFMLLFREILNPKYGMFEEYPESKMIWFSNHYFEEIVMYHLVGMLCGLAIYNSTLIDLPFPPVLYKKLLNVPAGLDDLKELSPVIGRSLEEILDYDGEEKMEDVFDLVFEVTENRFDMATAVELKPNGRNIPVTKDNRGEYVDLYVEYKLVKSVEKAFTGFRDGFNRVVTSAILNFFQPLELMELATGNQNYDWDEFEKNTQYSGIYWQNHPTIRLFWDVFHTLSLEEKKKFLLFVTGSDRIPLLGMSQIKLTIQPCQGGDSYFPVAHTCFNLLDLPLYSNRELLREKLLLSLEHSEGFTLA